MTCLAGADTLQGRRVAYLWPTSGLFTAVNMLLHSSGDEKYEDLLDTLIIPGLENYYDTSRKPECYKSYIVQAGRSDRFNYPVPVRSAGGTKTKVPFSHHRI